MVGPIWEFSLVSQAWVLHLAPLTKELLPSYVSSLDLCIVLLNIHLQDLFRLWSIWTQFAEQLQVNPLLGHQSRSNPEIFSIQRIMLKMNIFVGVTSWMAKGVRLMGQEVPDDFSCLFRGDLEGQMWRLARTGLVIPIKTWSVDVCKQMAGRQRETLNTWRKPTEELFFHQCQWVAMPGRYPYRDKGPHWNEARSQRGCKSWVCNKEALLNIQSCWQHFASFSPSILIFGYLFIYSLSFCLFT